MTALTFFDALGPAPDKVNLPTTHKLFYAYVVSHLIERLDLKSWLGEYSVRLGNNQSAATEDRKRKEYAKKFGNLSPCSDLRKTSTSSEKASLLTNPDMSIRMDAVTELIGVLQRSELDSPWFDAFAILFNSLTDVGRMLELLNVAESFYMKDLVSGIIFHSPCNTIVTTSRMDIVRAVADLVSSPPVDGSNATARRS